MVMWLPVFLSIILKKDVTNGIITQDTVYLRTLYQELSREHKNIKGAGKGSLKQV
jgi:hypothetical protein